MKYSENMQSNAFVISKKAFNKLQVPFLLCCNYVLKIVMLLEYDVILKNRNRHINK